ncbi:MAG: CHASE2 domain-containing protein [Acidobacteriia bacterium]|nr:CHASE2 domain-containing protein [Terriglobia bacterium]
MGSGGQRSGKNERRIRRWLFLNAVLFAVVALLSLTYPVEELSRRIGDLNFRWRGTRGTSPDVALVLIDDASLNRYGRWPWKRSLLARVVRSAAAEQPRALGLDILLSEPGDNGDDRELAQALNAAGNVVLVSKISSSQQGKLWVDPLPLFARSAVAIGHAQAALGPDSVCRSVPVRELSLEGPRWAFALEIARVARGVSLMDDGQHMRFGGTAIPAADETAALQTAGVETESPRFLSVDYRGQIEGGESAPPFAAVSVIDLLEGRAGSRLRGKAVLIGFGSTEIGDRVPTPVSGRIPMPGVEIHANIVDALLAGRGLHAMGAAYQILLLLLFTITSTWVVLRWPVWRGLLALGTLLAGVLTAGYLLFARAHILIELGPFFCAGVLAAPAAQLQNLFFLDRDISEGLRHLQRALRTTTPERAGNLSAALRLQPASPAGDLHWKIHLLRELQTELGSLYAFDETLLDAMQEGLAVFASEGRLVFHNPSWQSFCARHNWNFSAGLDAFLATLGDSRWQNLRESLSEPGTRLDTEVHFGEGLFQLRALRLSPSQAGPAGLILVVVTDLTARLERDRARAEALAFVTHELRTPLVSIQGFAEYLLRYPQQAAGSDAAATIFRESGRLVAMINTYLDVLRLEAGSQPLRHVTFDAADTLHQVKRLLEPLAQASGITVKTEIAADLPALYGDPPLITGALVNLLSNALKYSPRGSEIRLCALGDGNMVVLEVWNPGPVIPPRDLERLFEPFYRRREDEEAAPGWGLGLAFVKRIAEQHGGQIEASSDSRYGTCFRLRLPAMRNQFSEALK